MDNQMSDIELIFQAIPQNLDNPEWLSQVIVTLSTALYYHNTQMALAENEEKRALVGILENRSVDGKRMSVAEAEARAVVVTENEYGKLKAQAEGVIEAINSVKIRIRVLTWEKGQAVNE